MTTADDTFTITSRFVNTLVTIPIAFRYVHHFRFEAVRMVALVTAVAQ